MLGTDHLEDGVVVSPNGAIPGRVSTVVDNGEANFWYPVYYFDAGIPFGSLLAFSRTTTDIPSENNSMVG